MTLVDQFCFCGRLETGGIIVGILGIVGNLLVIKGSAVLITVLAQIYGEKLKPGSTPEEEEIYNIVCSKVTVMMVTSAFLVLSCIVNVITSILLIIGSQKRISGFVFAWLVASMVSIVIGFISIFVNFDIENLIGICIEIYWWICIYSLYQMLKREKLQPVQIEMSQIGAVQTKYVPGQGYPQTV